MKVGDIRIVFERIYCQKLLKIFCISSTPAYVFMMAWFQLIRMPITLLRRGFSPIMLCRDTEIVVMQSEGFKYLEESCPSLLADLLETVASVDDESGPLSRKRSGSSIFGLDLAADGAAGESVNPIVRRMRRRA
ncbi:unnamed protein product [Ilex paraguariensis]|uniref:Uncharacterized protein n=1 Tax=Ilex paraguariensis TaxID=185542 RepID=A0ABC8QZ87_9AQUA